MTETVVHVTTLEQWKSVLDVLFEQGYKWNHINDKRYMEHIFNDGSHYLILDKKYIRQSLNNFRERPFIEYSEFMAQRKENNKMETYYATKEQLDLIEELKSNGLPFYHLVNSIGEDVKDLSKNIYDELDRPILRYLGGDETIEFKVKEPLYWLVGVNKLGQVVYFDKTSILLPATISKEQAFTAPLEEIKKWQTPDWEIEKAD